MNFDRNVSCFIAVYALMDNDFFNQTVEGGCVQFRDVGVFLNGFYPLAGVIRKPDFIGQLLPAFLNPCFQLGLFLLRLFHQQIEVRFADTSGNHVLIQPQNHLFQNVNAFLVFGKGAFQRFPLAFLLGFAGVGQLPGNGFPVHQGSSGTFPDFVQYKPVQGVVLNPVLGTVLFPVGIVGLTGINLLRVLLVGKTAKSILISCASRLAPFDIKEVREITMYDELDLDMLGDERTALFLIMSDTDGTFAFLISLIYSILFNRLCERADDVYGGRLPIHVRCLIDEAANIGQIPNLERLMATIRSREISACLVLQAQSQLKALYKDNMDTIIGNCDASLFLGGKEETTLKSWNSLLGKETIDLYNTSVTKGNQESHGQNFQKLGKDMP